MVEAPSATERLTEIVRTSSSVGINDLETTLDEFFMTPDSKFWKLLQEMATIDRDGCKGVILLQGVSDSAIMPARTVDILKKDYSLPFMLGVKHARREKIPLVPPFPSHLVKYVEKRKERKEFEGLVDDGKFNTDLYQQLQEDLSYMFQNGYQWSMHTPRYKRPRILATALLTTMLTVPLTVLSTVAVLSSYVGIIEDKVDGKIAAFESAMKNEDSELRREIDKEIHETYLPLARQEFGEEYQQQLRQSIPILTEAVAEYFEAHPMQTDPEQIKTGVMQAFSDDEFVRDVASRLGPELRRAIFGK